MHWSKYPVTVGDSARTKIAVDNILAQGTADAQNWFDFVRDYDIITALKAGNHASCTAPATGVWMTKAPETLTKIFLQLLPIGSGGDSDSTGQACLYLSR